MHEWDFAATLADMDLLMLGLWNTIQVFFLALAFGIVLCRLAHRPWQMACALGTCSKFSGSMCFDISIGNHTRIGAATLYHVLSTMVNDYLNTVLWLSRKRLATLAGGNKWVVVNVWHIAQTRTLV